MNVVKRERFLFVSIITGTVQEIVQVERVAVRIFVKFEVHRREKLKILWDARDLVLVERKRRLTIFVVRFYRGHRKIRPIILLYQNRR